MIRRSELHDLACTDAGEGCVCQRPKLSVLGADKGLPDWHVAGQAVHSGVDIHLSSLESLLIVLEQRELDADQLDRFARLLQYGEREVMARVKRRR